MWWLVWMMCGAAIAMRPSSRTPLIFVVTTKSGLDEGTSIRTDGKWTTGEVDIHIKRKIKTVWPQATIAAVNTDDEVSNHQAISDWMERECEVVQRRDRNDCFVVSKFTYDLRTSENPYDFRRWESTERHVIKNALLAWTPVETDAPTMPHTSSPTMHALCKHRSRQDCAVPECEYIGEMWGCREPGWCGFTTRVACESWHGCEFRRNKCRRLQT